MTQNDTWQSIAVIGMAGRFPGAKSIEEFWQNLCDGKESISFFTNEELVAAGVDPALLNDPQYVKASAVLEDIEMFDAAFFGYTPREAEIIDPQHRLFLECAWEALENAGYNSETYTGLIGVYAGAALSTYLLKNLIVQPEISNLASVHQISMGNSPDFMPTRVSYKLNLKGPSVSIGTACSTSLVAVQMGCQSLLNYQCDMVLAGGVTITSRKEGYLYQEGSIASIDGHCRAFDAKAQGTVSGNGVGIVVLKRLEDALADGDHISAVIKGSDINNDGSLKVGYTAPSTEGQAKVIAEAMDLACVSPETITYIETHGTGTAIGDPIEIAALTKVFRAKTKKQGFCAIASLKTNIGHLGTTSGVAGLIKTVLALKHQMIPPSLHFEQPNPQIDFANSPFYVNTSLRQWQTNGIPRRAGVSSFGIGGTNAHIVLEEAPKLKISGESRPWQMLLLSAKTNSALETATTNLVEYLQQHPELNLADAAYTLQVGRWGFNYRRMVVCQNIEECITALKSPASQRVFTQFTASKKPAITFMFPGQGSQYVNMSRELYQTEPIFRDVVDYCCEQLKPHLGIDLRHILYPSETHNFQADQQLQQTYISQSSLFVIEYALAQLWIAWGVHPQAMIGHSIGEYVVATLAGVFSLEDALMIVATRGQLMQQLPGGTMLTVPLPKEEIIPLLNEKLSLAANNAPFLCVVSGTTEAINDLQNCLLAQGVNSRPLYTSHAFHSLMMEPVIEPFTQLLENIQMNPPKIPFISNLSGTWITVAEATDPNYWVKHLRQTVRFSEGIIELLKDAEGIFLEVGPGSTLTTLVMRHQIEEQIALPTTRHPQNQQSDVACILQTLGQLWLRGVQIDWAGFYSHEQRHRLPLPTYPFERQRYWIEPPKQVLSGIKPDDQQDLLTKIWQSLVASGRRQAESSILEVDEQNYLEKKQCMDRLCTAYIKQLFHNLGAFNHISRQYSLEELLAKCHIVSRYRQLLCRFLDVLVEQGELQQERGLFSSLGEFSTDLLNTSLEELRIKWADTPEVIEIIEQCGNNLAQVLTGEKEPLELYVAAKDSITENSSLQLPLNIYYKGIIRASLEAVVRLLPPQINLRILEIGGGRGVVTSELLPILPLTQTNYTFTDVSGLFLNEAKQKFSAYPFVEYGFLDIEKSPQEQGYKNHSFDVVIAVNVLHVAGNLGKTLDYVHSLLAPGGLLLLWEITQPELRFDLTVGILMNVVEDEERSRGNPFLSKEQWEQKLRYSGFVEVEAFSKSEVFGHDVLVAQTSALATNEVPLALTDSKDTTPKKPDVADWFYIPSWKRSHLPPVLNAVKPRCWLLFVDECGLGEKMAHRLALAGEDVITVKIGEQWDQLCPGSYRINPQQTQDYKVLLQELHTLGKIPSHIIHLWSVTPVDHGFLDNLAALGFYSLLFLAQAIKEQNLTNSIQMGIVSNNMQQVTGSEELCPEKAMILGPCQVIPLEYPNISCRSIDVVIPLPETWQAEKLIDQLLVEVKDQATDEQIIAYRGSHRWVQDFQPVKLEPTVNNPGLREKGVYLITGGLGGVGLALAEYLAQTVQAKLILIGRSPFPNFSEWQQWLSTHEPQDDISTKIRKLQNLEALGAEVMVLSADVANLTQMSAALEAANQRFGKIHGVIHAAAVLGGGIIQLTTKEAVENSIAAKVKGTRILERLFSDIQLDFFVLCSSLSSFAGASGIVDYTAANAFLDAFAHYKVSQNGNFTISINWDRWDGLGMAVAVAARHKAIAKVDLVPAMTVPQGIEAFKRILCSSTVPQVIVSTQDVITLIHKKNSLKSGNDELEPVSQTKPTYHRPNLDNAYVPPTNEIEQTLTEIWQQLLGIEQIGIHDNFFELGGDSLFASQLVSRICKTFEIELPYKSFYSTSTVAELARVIIQKLTQQTDQEALAQALAEIEQLSEDEVQKILASPAQSMEVEE
jgi:acyl transferase domain-containing protein/acyl carrier protein/2-polyprenyl-3-methyl-5-hydroxy-6-metoxy-1,4-benzoquinol methylase